MERNLIIKVSLPTLNCISKNIETLKHVKMFPMVSFEDAFLYYCTTVVHEVSHLYPSSQKCLVILLLCKMLVSASTIFIEVEIIQIDCAGSPSYDISVGIQVEASWEQFS